MGHVVGRDLKTVTFPFGYKFFTTNGVNNVTTDITTGTDTVAADSTQDTFGINSGNKWIRMKTDATNDNITIAHEIHTPITTAITDTTDLDNSQTFVIQDMQFDAAGHITHNQAHTYRLPDGFKYLQVGAATSAVTSPTAAEGKLEANNHVATFTISPSNRWITLSANASTDTLSIGHAFASAASQYDTQSTAQEPDFGGTVRIPYNGFDEAGHLSTFGTRTIKIPLPSLNVAEGDVVTGLTLDATKGAFTMTKQNVGTLTISDFVLGTNGSAISNTDTINSALAKLQVQLNTEVENRQNLDYKDESVRDMDGKYVHSVEQIDGKITAIRLDLPKTEAASEEEKAGKYVSDVTQEKGVITVHRELLPSYTDESVVDDDNSYVHSVKQTNGQIETVRKAFNFIPADATFVYAVENNDTTPEEEGGETPTEPTTPDPETLKTIEWLFAKVAELEARLAILEPPSEEEEVTPTT